MTRGAWHSPDNPTASTRRAHLGRFLRILHRNRRPCDELTRWGAHHPQCGLEVKPTPCCTMTGQAHATVAMLSSLVARGLHDGVRLLLSSAWWHQDRGDLEQHAGRGMVPAGTEGLRQKWERKNYQQRHLPRAADGVFVPGPGAVVASQSRWLMWGQCVCAAVLWGCYGAALGGPPGDDRAELSCVPPSVLVTLLQGPDPEG